MTSLGKLVAILAAFAVLAVAVAPPAGATPADDKRAEAKRIALRREDLTAEAERLNEASKAAQEQLDVVTHDALVVAATLNTQESQVADLRGIARTFALKQYLYGASENGLGAMVTMAAGNVADGTRRDGYLSVVLGSSGDTIDALRAIAADTDMLRQRLARQQAAKAALTVKLRTDAESLANAQNELDKLAASIDSDLAVLVAEEAALLDAETQSRERAAAERQAAAATRRSGQTTSPATTPVTRRPAIAAPGATVIRTVPPATVVPTVPTTKPVRPTIPATTATTANPATTVRPVGANPASPSTTVPAAPRTTIAPPPDYPAPSPAAGVAVAAAKSQLGKPYVFGSAGPDTFDCSGLTQWSWAKAGVAMSHFTVSQFNEFPHVPLSALQPGDLVFFKIDLGHMGMYIGGGLFIHAPRTGDVIKIGNLSQQNVVGAVRPG